MLLDTQNINIIFLDNLFLYHIECYVQSKKSFYIVTGNCYFVFLSYKKYLFPRRLKHSGEIIVIANDRNEWKYYPPFFINRPKDKKV